MAGTKYFSLAIPEELANKVDDYVALKNQDKEVGAPEWSRNRIIRIATEEYIEKHMIEILDQEKENQV